MLTGGVHIRPKLLRAATTYKRVPKQRVVSRVRVCKQTRRHYAKKLKRTDNTEAVDTHKSPVEGLMSSIPTLKRKLGKKTTVYLERKWTATSFASIN